MLVRMWGEGNFIVFVGVGVYRGVVGIFNKFKCIYMFYGSVFGYSMCICYVVWEYLILLDKRKGWNLESMLNIDI